MGRRINHTFQDGTVSEEKFTRLRKIKHNLQNLSPSGTYYKLADEEIRVWLDKLIIVPSNATLLNPSVSHLLKISTDNTVVHNICEYIFALINDRLNEDMQSGGSHWTLLVCIRAMNSYLHYDSLAGYNSAHARRFASKLSHCLSNEECANVVEMRCWQQEGNVECGAHSLHNLEMTCSLILNELPVTDDIFLQKSFVQNYYNQINSLLNNTKNPTSTLSLKAQTKSQQNINSSQSEKVKNKQEWMSGQGDGSQSNVIKLIKKKLPKAQIIINSITTRRDIWSTTLHRTNQNIWWLCKKLGVLYLNLERYIKDACLSRDGFHLNRRGTSMLNSIFMQVVSLCDNISSKATGFNSQGSLESHDQTANGKIDNYENFIEESSVLPLNHLSLHEYPPLLTPALATVYSWMIIVMRHLAALYLVSTTNEVDVA
ncbi:SUMO1 sentrin specific peptidase 8 [Homalodisca vitripennis]|nr:SUMO1 sentrin specific peptidase 8 [Homalodisca vitripennis]